MAGNRDMYYPAYMKYDGWVLKYLSWQRETAAYMFNEIPWGPHDYATVIPFIKHNHTTGARYFNGDLSASVHAARAMGNMFMDDGPWWTGP